MPFFVADSAQVTVMRRLASSSFGRYELKVPEGVRVEDIHTFAAPGNELGYVASLSGRRVGGFARRMMRADVSVTAASHGDAGWVPESNVDAVLRDAEARTAGDFFLESDISVAGLGRWRPFVDFNVGDAANVDIWGRVVQLKVTRIENRATDHNDVDWVVHVGGQLVSDEQARVAENASIHRQLMEDQRDLAGIEAQAAKAVAEAEAARAEAAGVKEFLTGSEAVTLLDSLRDINGQLQAQGEEEKPGLVPAYIDMNTRLWSQQDEINRQQSEIARVHDSAIEANSKAVAALEDWSRLQDEVQKLQDQQINSLVEVQRLMSQTTQRTFMDFPRSDGLVRQMDGLQIKAMPDGKHSVYFPPGKRVDAIISWPGKVGARSDMVLKKYVTHREPAGQWVQLENGLPGTEPDRWVEVTYQVLNGVQKQITISGLHPYIPFKNNGDWMKISNGVYDEWVRLGAYSIPGFSGNVVMSYSLMLTSSNRGTYYGLRFVRPGGEIIAQFYSNEVGPKTFFGNGDWEISLVKSFEVSAGEEIGIETFCSSKIGDLGEGDLLEKPSNPGGRIVYVDMSGG